MNNERPLSTASSFDQMVFWSARFGALLFTHIPIAPGLRILDLATGTGYPLLELAQVYGASCKVIGMDVWWEALTRAEAKRRTYGQENAALVCADGVALPFPDETFDMIVINLGLNNFANAKAVLAECARVTGHGGRLVATTNLKGHFREFYAPFREAVTKLGKPDALERLNTNENHRGTRESWSALLKGAGFKLTKVVEDAFTMRYTDSAAMFSHLLTRVGFLPGWEGVVDEADRAKVFAEVRRELDTAAYKQGEVRMTVPMLYLEARR